MVGEKKTPLKWYPAELLTLHAGCSPGSCQAVCSPCMQSLPAGSLPICRQRAQSQSGSCKQHSTGPGALCVAALEHILQLCCPRRQQLNTSLHCKVDVGAAWPGPHSYRATVLYCSYWDGAPAATE